MFFLLFYLPICLILFLLLTSKKDSQAWHIRSRDKKLRELDKAHLKKSQEEQTIDQEDNRKNSEKLANSSASHTKSLSTNNIQKTKRFNPFSIGKATSAHAKGEKGERLVAEKLAKNLPDSEYTLLNNITLPIQHKEGNIDGTTQIDHILFSKYGVFVIETKHMEGWIFGSIKRKKWTQKLYKKTFTFQNPLHQNYRHVSEIQKLTDLDSSAIISIVVFTGKSEFKTKMADNVLHLTQLLEFIQTHQQEQLNSQKIETARQRIEENRLEPSAETNNQHVAYLMQKHQALTN